MGIVENVGQIAGSLFTDNNAFLDLNSTAAADVGAFSNSTLRMAGGSARSVLADQGTVDLQGVSVADRIDVFGKGHLTFTQGSTLGHSLTNFGDERGLVVVSGGRSAGIWWDWGEASRP